MDWLTFGIRLIEALAWPVAAVIIVWVFRQNVRQLLSLVRKLKAGPVEAEFERTIREISQETALTTTLEIEQKPDPIKTKLIELSKQDPRAAIIEAWMRAEVVIRRAALQNATGSPLPDVSSPLKAWRALVQAEVLDADDVALFHVLRGLRNQAAHIEAFEPSGGAALVYIHLARQLELRLLKLADPMQSEHH